MFLKMSHPVSPEPEIEMPQNGSTCPQPVGFGQA
jgi:hypothetical protein